MKFNKVELKKQLNSLGVKLEGNYINKKDIKKILAQGEQISNVVELKKLTEQTCTQLQNLVPNLNKIKDMMDDIGEIEGLYPARWADELADQIEKDCDAILKVVKNL